jgi:hypothetical protein
MAWSRAIRCSLQSYRSNQEHVCMLRPLCCHYAPVAGGAIEGPGGQMPINQEQQCISGAADLDSAWHMSTCTTRQAQAQRKREGSGRSPMPAPPGSFISASVSPTGFAAASVYCTQPERCVHLQRPCGLLAGQRGANIMSTCLRHQAYMLSNS